MIRVEGLYFGYPHGPEVLQDINMTVRPGEFIAVMGPNGSGKSTLAHLLTGFLQPRQGRVDINGKSTVKSAGRLAVRQQIGLLVSNPDDAIIGNTVEEDVAFGPENLDLTPQQIKNRVDTALQTVFLEDKRYYPPHLLSGGEKQRLCLAGILALEPACLVLDEPLAMVDRQDRAALLSVLQELKAKGHTIILITHHLEEALGADRIILLSRGRIVADRPLRDMISSPEMLQQAGIEPLEISQIIAALNQLTGWAIPADLIHPEELVNYLCRSWSQV